MRVTTTDNTLAVLVMLALVASIGTTATIMSRFPLQLSITGMAQSQGQGTTNVTLASEANIELIVDVIEFGYISPGKSNDTTDFSPYPFRLKNNGSAYINVSVAELSTDLFWDRDDYCEECFQFNATPCNTTTKASWYAPWTDFNDSYESADFGFTTDPPNLVFNLSNYEDPDENYIFIHVKITVPGAESAGLKETSVLFKASTAAS